MKAWKISVVLPFLAVSLWAAAPSVNEVSLPERALPQLDGILKSAMQQSPRMLNRALDLEIAENSRIQARAALLPNFGASYTFYEARDERADIAGRQNVQKVYYNVMLTQPLFHWGERNNIAKIGEIQSSISNGQYRDGYRLLAQELRASYMRLIVQKLSVKRTAYYRQYAASQLKQQEERLAKGAISAAVLSAAQLSDEQAQIALERTEFDFANAKATFARLAGLGSISDDGIPDAVPATSYVAAPFDQLLAGFLSQKDPPTMEAATFRKQIEVEALNYANHKTRLKPKVNAVIGTNQDEQSYSINVAQKYRVNSIFGGVSVNWQIFDGYSSQAAVRSSMARRRQMENDYRQLTERLAQDAQTEVKVINFAARNMAIYERFLTSGEGYLKMVQDDFQRGVKSESEVNLAQLSLYDAQINANNARIDYLLRVGDFLGTLMEDPVLANVAEQ